MYVCMYASNTYIHTHIVNTMCIYLCTYISMCIYILYFVCLFSAGQAVVAKCLFQWWNVWLVVWICVGLRVGLEVIKKWMKPLFCVYGHSTRWWNEWKKGIKSVNIFQVFMGVGGRRQQPESRNHEMEKDESVNDEELLSFCLRWEGYQEKDQW